MWRERERFNSVHIKSKSKILGSILSNRAGTDQVSIKSDYFVVPSSNLRNELTKIIYSLVIPDMIKQIMYESIGL